MYKKILLQSVYQIIKYHLEDNFFLPKMFGSDALGHCGSFYILVLIAGLDLRYKIMMSLGSRIPWEIAKILRRPETSSMSCLTYLSLLLHCACRHNFLDP